MSFISFLPSTRAGRADRFSWSWRGRSPIARRWSSVLFGMHFGDQYVSLENLPITVHFISLDTSSYRAMQSCGWQNSRTVTRLGLALLCLLLLTAFQHFQSGRSARRSPGRPRHHLSTSGDAAWFSRQPPPRRRGRRPRAAPLAHQQRPNATNVQGPLGIPSGGSL